MCLPVCCLLLLKFSFIYKTYSCMSYPALFKPACLTIKFCFSVCLTVHLLVFLSLSLSFSLCLSICLSPSPPSLSFFLDLENSPLFTIISYPSMRGTRDRMSAALLFRSLRESLLESPLELSPKPRPRLSATQHTNTTMTTDRKRKGFNCRHVYARLK